MLFSELAHSTYFYQICGHTALQHLYCLFNAPGACMLSFPPGTHNVYPLFHFLSLAETADFIHLSKRSAFGFVHFFCF